MQEEEKQNIIDICDEGDIFGLRPLMVKENYILIKDDLEVYLNQSVFKVDTVKFTEF